MFITWFARAFPVLDVFGFVGPKFYPAFILQKLLCIGGTVPVEVADGVGVVEVKGVGKVVREFVRKSVREDVRSGVSEGSGKCYQVIAFVMGDCWDGID